MILPSLCLVLAPSGPLPSPTHTDWVLSAYDGEDFAEVGAWEGQAFLLPAVTRSEVVSRAVAGSRGVGVALALPRTSAGDWSQVVRVRAFEHDPGSQVLFGPEGPILVGPPRLPRSARGHLGRAGERDVLPHLARQDGNAVAGELELELEADPDGEWTLVALPAPTSRRGRNHTRHAALVALPPSTEPARHRFEPPTNAPTDQVFLARVRALEPGDARPLERRALRANATPTEGSWRTLEEGALHLEAGTRLEAWFAPPAVAEGRTWTLWVELALPRDELPGTTEAPAPEARAADAKAAVAKAAVEQERRDEPPARWVEAGPALGVDFVHFEGPDEQLDIRPTMGPGAAWGDADGDGWTDLYLAQGGGRPGSLVSPSRLYHNVGGVYLEDVTRVSGAGQRAAGMGALFFDAEGDGDLDLYVANYGRDALFQNDGRGKFEEVGERVGLAGERWSAGVAAADADRDGDLDLYVTSYLRYDEDLLPAADELAGYRREDPVPMLPFAFPGEANVYYRNESVHRAADGSLVSGPLSFEDAATELGLLDELGRGMQPLFWDFDRDGDPDLYVANDVSYNALFRNEGDGRFKDVSFAIGLDDPRGGMGLASGDLDLDGDEDLVLTNWQLETNALYQNNLLSHQSQRHRVATFRDATVEGGFGPDGIGVTSWGVELLDADLDGDLDLFVANGYTSPDYESTGICVGQPNHFFLNDGEGRFAAEHDAPALRVSLASRAAVACDYDLDGDPDLVVTANNGRAQLLENRSPEAEDHHWVLLRLEGAGANTHAIGAEVTLHAGDRVQRRSLHAGTSYLGGNPPELGFGLGAVERIDAVEVRWPSGRTSTHEVPVDGVHTLREPR